MTLPTWKSVKITLLLAAAYFVTGRLGLMLPAVGANITLIWLPTGIAVAGLLRYGTGCWPGVALGALGVNLAMGAALSVALCMAAGNTLGPLLAVWILRRVGFRPALDRQRDVLFLTMAATAGMVVCASVGVAALSLAGEVQEGQLAAWLTWWAGDTMGVIIAAPLVFAYTLPGFRTFVVQRVEFAAWLCITALLTWGVFVANRGAEGVAPLPLAFVPLAMVGWGALRYGPVGTSTALIVISVGAAYGTATGTGPFLRSQPIESVGVLWLFMAMSATLGWIVSALHAARVQSAGVQRVLEKALSDVSLGVTLTGTDQRITYINQGFTQLTGYTQSELLGKSFEFIDGPETDSATVERLKAAARSDVAIEEEILHYRKDGTTFWNALLLSPATDERGERIGLLGIQRDITQRKQTELALRESEERYRNIVETAEEGVWTIDVEQKTSFVNPTMARMLGYTVEEMLGCELHDFMDEEGRAISDRNVERRKQGISERHDFKFRRKDGSALWAHLGTNPILDDSGAYVGALAMVTDIGERKAAAEALHESQVRLQTLVANLPGMAYRCRNDSQWTMIYVSVGCEAITGYRNEELVGSGSVRYVALLHEDDREAHLEKCKQLIEDGTPCQDEYRIIDRDGREHWVIERASGVHSDDGELLFIDGFIQDVTEARQAKIEREQLDRKMQETQKLESLGVLAGGIAHDFNNLLATVMGNASLAELDLPPGSPVHDNIAQITEASVRAADLCNQMLAYSGKGRFVVETLDLGELVEQTAKMLRISISKKASLHFDLEQGLPPVKVDATQVGQVIMNLVINASEALGDETGVIRLSTGLVRADREYLAGTLSHANLPEGEYVYLEVSDTGPGMSSETQAKIFDPFFTTKFAGRGLGLAAVLGIARGHEGTLRVESDEENGTSFRVLFPAARGATGAPSIAADTDGQWRGEGTVLVADDEQGMRDTLMRMLRRLGFEAVLVTDGREAVEVFRSDPDRFALVLLDLTMPNQGGEQTFVELRKLRPDARVVLMSGFNAKEATFSFNGEGPASFLKKPFSVDALREVLQSVLG